MQKLKNDAETMQQLFNSLKYEDCLEGHTVFNYGDQGNTFYILLAGEVEIRVPTPVELENSSNSPEGLLVFLITYYDIIYWEKIPNGFAIKKTLNEGLKHLQLSLKDDDRQEMLAILGNRIVGGKTELHRQLYKYFEQSSSKTNTIRLHWLKTVQVMHAGDSFGERALIKQEPRIASVFCTKSCFFTTMTRQDYNQVIGNFKKKELKHACEYFRQFRIFKKLRAAALERIQYYMKEREFTLGQTLFRQGHSEVDGVYFIKNGDFEVTVQSEQGVASETRIQTLVRSSSQKLQM